MTRGQRLHQEWGEGERERKRERKKERKREGARGGEGGEGRGEGEGGRGDKRTRVLPSPSPPLPLSPSLPSLAPRSLPLSLSLSLSPSLSPSPSPPTPGLSCRRPAPRPLGCAESRGTPAVAPLPLSPLGDLRALGVLRGEGGGRKKEKGGERRSPCACVCWYTAAAPPVLSDASFRPPTYPREGLAVFSREGTPNANRNTPPHHHHPHAQRHSPLPLLSSSPPLSRTHKTRTNTHQPRKPPPHNHARPCPRGQIGQWGEREGARKKTPFPGPQTPPYLTRAGWAGWGSTQEGQGANFPEGGGRPPPGAGTLSPIYIQIRP